MFEREGTYFRRSISSVHHDIGVNRKSNKAEKSDNLLLTDNIESSLRTTAYLVESTHAQEHSMYPFSALSRMQMNAVQTLA